MKKKIFTLAILACMMFVTACSGQDTPVTADTTATDAVDNTEADESKITPDIPADLRFDGRSWRVLCTYDAPFGPILDDFVLEESADVYTQALYNRLVKTEERFGIDIVLNYCNGPEQCAPLAQQSILSGNDDYDLVVDTAIWHLSQIYDGLYTPVNDLPYIDLEKPWWNKEYIESVSVNPSNPYILFGSINQKAIERSCCTFVNTDLLEERKDMTANELYDMVLDGKWTLDRMIELNKDTYDDANGNTVKDDSDYHGLIHDNFYSDYLVYSCGLEFTGRDEDGYPVLNMNNDRTVEFCDKLISLFHSPDSYSGRTQNESIATFASGHALFYTNRIFTCVWGEMRDTNMNYAIIPNPKFDETVEDYYTNVAANTQWHMVPVTHSDLEFTSAVTEYFAFLGYEEVIPAYYDITVKFKYTRGDVDGASQMLDIITETQRTDFMSVNTLGGMEKILAEIVKSGQNTFSSKYAQRESGAKYHLKKYIDSIG